MTTAERIEAIKERARKVTPGPWEGPWFEAALIRNIQAGLYGKDAAIAVMRGQCSIDGDFIAHARTDLPWAIAELEKRDAELAHLSALAVPGAICAEISKLQDRIGKRDVWLKRAMGALEFYGGNTDEGGIAFMQNPGGGFIATESSPGEAARNTLAALKKEMGEG